MKFEEHKQKVFAEHPEMKEEYEKLKVPVDDMFCEMMNWAVRYALGRRTYAASDTAGYMMRVLKLLDDQTIYVMLRDIEWNESHELLGDECDAVEWMKLKESIQKEIGRRKNNESST